jgi:hypothetical protein
MKKFTFVVAFVLLATIQASAAEISQAAPATTPLLQQIEGAPPPPLFKGPHPIPRCYTLAGTTCSTYGATTPCTDVCNNQLSCTCQNIYAPPYYIIVIGHYWLCNQEC